MRDESDPKTTEKLLQMAESKEAEAVNREKTQPGEWLQARQAWTALGPIMSTIVVGITSGYSAVLLPQLKSTGHGLGRSNHSFMEEEDHPWTNGGIVVDNREIESWIAASGALLMAPGCWLSGLFMDFFGRKTSQLIISPIFLAGWLTIALAPNSFALIAGRLVCGLCTGLQGPLGPVYVAETSQPSLRGILMSSIALALAIGILISHVLGTWLHWRLAAHLSAVFPIVCFFCCLFATESPAWLLKKNRLESSRKAWLYLRGETAEEEYESMRARNTITNQDEINKTSHGASRPWWRSPSFLKPLLVLNVFFLTAQFSGINAVAFYCVQMVQDLSGPGGKEDAYWSMLVLDVIRLAASLMACWLTRNHERRFLAGISGVGSSASLLSLGVVLFLEVGRPWLPITLLLAYICVVSIGLVPLPWMLCGELFPVTFRGLGSGLSSGFAFICFFIVVKTGPAMFEDIGTPGTFTIYGTATLCGTIFLYFFLPETKDKTLQEIEEAFATSSKNRTKPTKTEPV